MNKLTHSTLNWRSKKRRPKAKGNTFLYKIEKFELLESVLSHIVLNSLDSIDISYLLSLLNEYSLQN